MIRYAVIAGLYVAGAFVSGGYYHRDATDRCFSNVYGRTIMVMAVWPVIAPQIMIKGLATGCDK